MKSQMSNYTKFTIWVVACVSIGLITAAIDGVSPDAIFKVALIAACIMIIGLAGFYLLKVVAQKHRDI